MFTTNKYTRPLLTSELKQLPTKSFTSIEVFVNAINPVAGARSAKFAILKSYVGGASKFSKLFNASSRAAAKKNLLKALNS